MAYLRDQLVPGGESDALVLGEKCVGGAGEAGHGAFFESGIEIIGVAGGVGDGQFDITAEELGEIFVAFFEHFAAVVCVVAAAPVPDVADDDFQFVAGDGPHEEEAAGGEAIEQALVDRAEGGDLEVDGAGAIDGGELLEIVGDAAGEAGEFGMIFPAFAVEAEVDAHIGDPADGLMAEESVVDAMGDDVIERVHVGGEMEVAH